MDFSPFVSSWHLDEQGRTVHKGLDSNGVESHRETNFFEARAVHKGVKTQ